MSSAPDNSQGHQESSNEADDIGVVINGKIYPYIENNPLDVISLIGLLLGVVIGSSIGLLQYSFFNNFNWYLVAVSLFHFLEFYITAKFNPGKVTSDSYLFNNGAAYTFSFVFAVSETIIEYYLFPNWKSCFRSKVHAGFAAAGLLLMVLGQVARSMAMITAGRSFSHQVKTSQNRDHVLVTTGVYSRIRHPSYFGYFWWAIGTQMWLLNPVSLIMFSIVLWRFFNSRILFEERYLVAFFGEEYIKYRKHVTVGIPFIN